MAKRYRSQSVVCRLFAQVDFRREMRPIAFADPGASIVTYLLKLPTRRLRDNLREGGLGDRLWPGITYHMAISHTVIRSLIPSALRNAGELRFLPSPFELTLLEKVGLDR
jgi:hypothetical protein